MTRSNALVILFACCFAASCGGDGPDGDFSDSGAQTPGLAEFDGTWRADCDEYRVFGEPEDTLPEGFVQITLTIDSTTSTYSRAIRRYADEQCIIEDSNGNTGAAPREIRAEGVITTSSGLEATIVRYNSGEPSSELLGLLYRDGDILYRESRQSTLIEPEVVPTELALSSPMRLVN